MAFASIGIDGCMLVLVGASRCAMARLPIGLEYIVAAAAVFTEIALFFISTWHTSLMYGRRPEEVWLNTSVHAESYTLFALQATVISVCMYMPIRSFVLWVAPVAAVVAYLSILIFVGSCFPQPMLRTVPTLTFVCVMQFHGARRHEQHRREKWLALRRVQEQDTALQNAASLARALSEMAGTLSDVVLMLEQDLTIMNTGNDLKAYFGKPVAGSTLRELLSYGDRFRVDKISAEALSSGIMQSMPASLELEFATVQVQLVVVSTGSRAPCFIAGLHTVGQTPNQEGVLATDICGFSDVDKEDPLEDAFSELGSIPGNTKLESLASTTNTGRVFASVDEVRLKAQRGEQALGDVQQVMNRIAAMGLREHWLIQTRDITILPGRVLGTGGFGVVVMACLRGTPVAAKLPRELDGAKNLGQLSSVTNELRIHRHLRHSNIALFCGACIDPLGSIALIYEHIQGTPLHNYVLSSLAQDDDVVRTKLCLDIASAIGYLHTWTPPIVHGDLKPSNILVEEMRVCPRAKLLDFGLARGITKNAKPLGGTRSWMAPELVTQRASPPQPSPAADIFSFGMVTYFVVTGREPLRSLDIPGPHVTSLPLVWPGLSALEKSCSECCGECLSFDPARRPNMPMVQTWLQMCLPEDPRRLQRLGRATLSLLLDFVPWNAGLEQLRRGGPNVDGLCTWPEHDEEDSSSKPSDFLQESLSPNCSGSSTARGKQSL